MLLFVGSVFGSVVGSAVGPPRIVEETAAKFPKPALVIAVAKAPVETRPLS